MMQAATVAIRVWDLPTRLFHWLLVLLVTTSVVTGKFDSIFGADTIVWHQRSGLGILGLLAFRLVWGFAGGRHARFANFLRGPEAVLAYAKAMGRPESGKEPVGHNPLGGWSVLAMLAALAVQASTGLFIVQEDYGFEGPLAKHVSRAVSDRLNDIHETNLWIIGVLVALHLCAIAFYTIVKRQDLIGAMLSGRKRVAAGREGEASRGGGALAGLAAAAVAACAVWALVSFA